MRAVDVAILTVIAPELDAAHGVFKNLSPSKTRQGTIVHEATLPSTLLERDLRVVIVCVGGAGNPGAAAATQEILLEYKPKAVLLMGIAGGLRDKVRIGEVVLSDRIVSYEPAALVRKKGRASVQARPEIDRTPHEMNQCVVHYRGEPDRLRSRFDAAGWTVPSAPRGRKREFAQHVASTISYRVGTIASGEKLLRDPVKFEALRMLHGRVEAGEMEATGFVEACRRANVPWLVVRGISDFGDELKDDRFHAFASQTAATVLADFLSHGFDLVKKPQKKGGKQAASSVMTATGNPSVEELLKTLEKMNGPQFERLVFLVVQGQHTILPPPTVAQSTRAIELIRFMSQRQTGMQELQHAIQKELELLSKPKPAAAAPSPKSVPESVLKARAQVRAMLRNYPRLAAALKQWGLGDTAETIADALLDCPAQDVIRALNQVLSDFNKQADTLRSERQAVTAMLYEALRVAVDWRVLAARSREMLPTNPREAPGTNRLELPFHTETIVELISASVDGRVASFNPQELAPIGLTLLRVPTILDAPLLVTSESFVQAVIKHVASLAEFRPYADRLRSKSTSEAADILDQVFYARGHNRPEGECRPYYVVFAGEHAKESGSLWQVATGAQTQQGGLPCLRLIRQLDGSIGDEYVLEESLRYHLELASKP